jgi:hypothetical protein
MILTKYDEIPQPKMNHAKCFDIYEKGFAFGEMSVQAKYLFKVKDEHSHTLIIFC